MPLPAVHREDHRRVHPGRAAGHLRWRPRPLRAGSGKASARVRRRAGADGECEVTKTQNGEHFDRLVDDEGLLHVVWNDEYTLCGMAFDELSSTGETVMRGVITCPVCAKRIIALRGVRVSPDALRSSRTTTDLHSNGLAEGRH